MSFLWPSLVFLFCSGERGKGKGSSIAQREKRERPSDRAGYRRVLCQMHPIDGDFAQRSASISTDCTENILLFRE